MKKIIAALFMFATSCFAQLVPIGIDMSQYTATLNAGLSSKLGTNDLVNTLSGDETNKVPSVAAVGAAVTNLQAQIESNTAAIASNSASIALKADKNQLSEYTSVLLTNRVVLGVSSQGTWAYGAVTNSEAGITNRVYLYTTSSILYIVTNRICYLDLPSTTYDQVANCIEVGSFVAPNDTSTLPNTNAPASGINWQTTFGTGATVNYAVFNFQKAASTTLTPTNVNTGAVAVYVGSYLCSVPLTACGVEVEYSCSSQDTFGLRRSNVYNNRDKTIISAGIGGPIDGASQRFQLWYDGTNGHLCWFSAYSGGARALVRVYDIFNNGSTVNTNGIFVR